MFDRRRFLLALGGAASAFGTMLPDRLMAGGLFYRFRRRRMRCCPPVEVCPSRAYGGPSVTLTADPPHNGTHRFVAAVTLPGSTNLFQVDDVTLNLARANQPEAEPSKSWKMRKLASDAPSTERSAVELNGGDRLELPAVEYWEFNLTEDECFEGECFEAMAEISYIGDTSADSNTVCPHGRVAGDASRARG